MTESPQTTKEKILTAATDIFGREGFKATTIRIIAGAAKVNVAAINYHFGDKEGLYGAVLAKVFDDGFTRFPSNFGFYEGISPEEKLRAFIRGMFYRLLSNAGWAGGTGRGRLIARELLAPTPALEPILERYITPHKDVLVSILIAIIGRNPGPSRLMPCAISIIGQCIYYALAAPVIAKISGEDQPSEDNLERLAEFVWRFSLGGIERISRENDIGRDHC